MIKHFVNHITADLQQKLALAKHFAGCLLALAVDVEMGNNAINVVYLCKYAQYISILW